MKTVFSCAAAAAALLIMNACNKNDRPPLPIEEGRIRVEIGIEGTGATRATGIVTGSEASEAKVNDLQIFVFNGDQLDGYAHGTSTKSLSVSCTAGSRDIYAIVNAPSLANITSSGQLLGTVSTLVEDIRNFRMAGKTTEMLPGSGVVTVPVGRLAARVVLKSIRNGLKNNPETLLIRSVYLTNVAGDVNFGCSPDYVAQTWYNRRGYQHANCLGSFNRDAVDAPVSQGQTYNTAHYFYSMPNAFEPAAGGPWTPRRSKLVIQASIGGTVYDYPILLPALEANHSYEIEMLTITRTGNPDNGREPTSDDDTDEEDLITGKNVTFEITVKPWTVVTVSEGTTI